MENYKNFFKKKKIIITGHTGFKGSWLSLWLYMLGANVVGVSNSIPSKPSHFNKLKLKKKIKSYFLDIRDLKKLKKVFNKTKPDFVFHLAAQSIVKKSYADPIYNFETNIIGTANVLECLKKLNNNCIAVMITSDKSYKNIEVKRGYKEDDLLGGDDPYSASKGSAEFVIHSYCKSFFEKNKKKNILIGVARAGNVIGGGDWSDNRLIPDCVKKWSINKTVTIRNPRSTRPWQHVLDVLNGYLTFAINLKKRKIGNSIFNFGPSKLNNFTVLSLLEKIKKYWPIIEWKVEKKIIFFESKLLKLNSDKAKNILQWKNILNFDQTIKLVVDWYKNYYLNKISVYEISVKQIQYFEKLRKKNF